MAATGTCTQCDQVEEYFVAGLTKHEQQQVRVALTELRRQRPELISQEQLVKLMLEFE